MLLRLINGELWAGTGPDDFVYVGTVHTSSFMKDGQRGLHLAVESNGEAELTIGMLRWETSGSTPDCDSDWL